MQLSARILGQDYGVTGAEMNRILVKQGFLTGNPGNYSATEKGMKYAIEEYFHRGNGGYAHYNRYWSTRTFDESIKEVLNVTPQIIQEVRKEMANERAVRSALQAAERAKANSDFLTSQIAKKSFDEASELVVQSQINNFKKIGLTSGIVVGLFVGGYCVYKISYKIKTKKAQKQQIEDVADKITFSKTTD